MIFGQDPSYFATCSTAAHKMARQGKCWRHIPALLATTSPVLKTKLPEALHILDEQSAQIPPSGTQTGF